MRFEVAVSSLPANLQHPILGRLNAANSAAKDHEHNQAGQEALPPEAVGDPECNGHTGTQESPPTVDARIKQKETNLATYAQLPERKRRRAEARLSVLNICDDFIRKNDLTRSKGEELFALEYSRGRIEVAHEMRHYIQHLSVRTLRAWFAAEREHGMLGLADDFGNRKGLCKLDAHPEIVKDIIGLILTKTVVRPGLVFEYLSTKYPGKTKTFSPKTVERFIARWRKENDQIYAKLTDPDRWKNQYKVAFGSQSEAVTVLNALWSLDDTKADILCADGRHSAVFLIDIYSRRIKILITKTVNAVTVGTLLRSGIIAWGAPQAILVDNGKVYCNTHIDGAMRSLEIKKLECTPYASEEKGIVERVQGTFQRDLLELLPGFVGHNVADRKRIEAKRAFGQRTGDPVETFEVRMTGAELQAFANDWCESRYQHKPHTGLPINPRTGEHFTPWERARSWHEPVRSVDERALDVLLLMVGETRTVTKKGIVLDRARYIHAELVPHIGRQVIVRPDPDDLGKAIVHTAESHEFICIAESTERAGISLKEKSAEATSIQKQHLRQASEIAKEARRAARQEDPVRRILQRDRDSMAKIADFPSRTVTHVTRSVETAIEASDGLRESKVQKRKTSQRSTNGIELDIPHLTKIEMRIRIRYALGRAFEPHEINWLNQWHPNGAREDQISKITEQLRSSQNMREPDGVMRPAASGAKE